jgi:hypothetical protein
MVIILSRYPLNIDRIIFESSANTQFGLISLASIFQVSSITFANWVVLFLSLFEFF